MFEFVCLYTSCVHVSYTIIDKRQNSRIAIYPASFFNARTSERRHEPAVRRHRRRRDQNRCGGLCCERRRRSVGRVYTHTYQFSALEMYFVFEHWCECLCVCMYSCMNASVCVRMHV